MKASIFLILAIFLFPVADDKPSCSCKWQGSFLDVSQNSSFVALVRVKRHTSFKKLYDNRTPMSMEVDVLEVLKGRERRKTVKVWGDNGDLCRPYLSDFPKGSTWVIAFDKGSTTRGHDDERSIDYSISICGEYWMPVERGRVKGVIEGKYEYRKVGEGKFIRNEKRISWGEFRNKFLGRN
ncbi:MAG: hypothetical protein AAF696_18315 [Bacteroidota bacterium]